MYQTQAQIILAILKKIGHALEIGIEIEKENRDRNLEQRKYHLNIENCS